MKKMYNQKLNLDYILGDIITLVAVKQLTAISYHTRREDNNATLPMNTDVLVK